MLNSVQEALACGEPTDTESGESMHSKHLDPLLPAYCRDPQVEIKADDTKNVDSADSDDDMFEVTATSIPGDCAITNADGKSAISQDDCNNFAKHNGAESSVAVIKRNHFVKGLLNTKEAQHLLDQSWKIDFKTRMAAP